VGSRQLHQVRQTRFGRDVDEALLELDLLQAAAEGQERELDAIERPPHAVAIGEVAHHQLQWQRRTSLVDEHTTRLGSVSYQRSRRLTACAERRSNSPGDPTTGGDDQGSSCARHSGLPALGT
jgi:hypothetical protein